MTTVEITIRFNDRADISAFWEDLVCHFDVAAEFKGGLVNGLYFKTDRMPQHFLDWMFANNFEMQDFSMELKAAREPNPKR